MKWFAGSAGNGVIWCHSSGLHSAPVIWDAKMPQLRTGAVIWDTELPQLRTVTWRGAGFKYPSCSLSPYQFSLLFLNPDAELLQDRHSCSGPFTSSYEADQAQPSSEAGEHLCGYSHSTVQEGTLPRREAVLRRLRHRRGPHQEGHHFLTAIKPWKLVLLYTFILGLLCLIKNMIDKTYFFNKFAKSREIWLIPRKSAKFHRYREKPRNSMKLISRYREISQKLPRKKLIPGVCAAYFIPVAIL